MVTPAPVEIHKVYSNKATRLLSDHLSLYDAIEIALLENPKLVSLYKDLDVSALQLEQATLPHNPHFEAEVHHKGGGIGIGTNLNILGDLVDLLLLPSKNKIGKELYDAKKVMVQKEMVEIILLTKKSFISYQFIQQAIGKIKDKIDLLDIALEVCKRQMQVSAAAKYQCISPEKKLLIAKSELQNLEVEGNKYREMINISLGLSGKNINWKAEDTLPVLPTKNLPEMNYDILAIHHNPQVIALRHQIEAQSYSKGVTDIKSLIPSFEAGPFIEGESGHEVYVGPKISFPIPIFNLGSDLRAEEKIKLEGLIAEYQNAVIESQAQARIAVMHSKNAFSMANDLTKKLLPLSIKETEEAQRRYNGMLIGVYDLLEIKSEEIDIAVKSLEAARLYWSSLIDLESALGGILPKDFPKPEYDIKT